MMLPKNLDKISMSMVTIEERATEGAKLLERNRVRRLRVKRDHARADVSRETKLSLGTLDNLCRGRFKSLRIKVAMALQSALLRERTLLEHEKQMLLQAGVAPHSREMAAILEDIAAINVAIGASR